MCLCMKMILTKDILNCGINLNKVFIAMFYLLMKFLLFDDDISKLCIERMIKYGGDRLLRKIMYRYWNQELMEPHTLSIATYILERCRSIVTVQ